jgi:DNA gyrase subunit A
MDTPNIHSVNIEDEMRQSYMDYAMSVIVGRALPDVRDGLKPVQRRVLYAMMGEGLTSGRKHSKCAGVVGEVLKRLHPHGDQSVYDALVRLAQSWNLRYPLVDGQGNFGSVDGDPAAAYRYTECRMTALAEQFLQDLDKETVDFIPNFDDSNVEPTVLPTVIPNLLVNGADGIAVGMATHVPPHNLAEVISGTIAYIREPGISLEKLMKHIPGPDFPTGGIIYGRGSIVSAYAHGKGVLQVRARAEIEKLKGKTREGEAIIVTEIPFQVNKARLIEKIAELVNDKTIEGISKLRDETDRAGMRIVMELKRDATPEVVLNQLFKLTPMQTSFGVINLAIVEGKPVICTLVQLLRHFVDHRRDVVIRRTQFELGKARERMHILEGFLIALQNLDEVIDLIKKSPTPKDAKEGLQARFQLSSIQAQAVLDLRLQKLTGMERLAIETEHRDLGAEIERLLTILASSEVVDNIIVGELEQVRDRFGDKRRTEILDDGAEIGLEDLIEDEEMVITVSHQGYIKRIPAATYKAQKRGGKGIMAASSKDEDFVEQVFVASAKADLLVFSTNGKVYPLKVYEIPEAGRTARGRALVNLLNLKEDEKVTSILPVREFTESSFVVMVTRKGVIKRVDLMQFSRSRKGGLIALSLNEGDALIGVAISSGNDDIILASNSGRAMRFSERLVRKMGRTARGVRGMRFRDDDFLVGMAIAPGIGGAIPDVEGEGAIDDDAIEGDSAEDLAEEEADEIGDLPESEEDEGVVEEDNNEATLLTVCEHGYGKRTKLSAYPIRNRGGMGVIDIKTIGRNGDVVGVCAVNREDGVMIVTSSGKMIRLVASGISIKGRRTSGVRLINLEEGEKVVAVAHVMEAETE